MLLGYISRMEALIFALEVLEDNIMNMMKPEDTSKEWFDLIKLSGNIIKRRLCRFKQMYKLDKTCELSKEYIEHLDKMLNCTDSLIEAATGMISIKEFNPADIDMDMLFWSNQ